MERNAAEKIGLHAKPCYLHPQPIVAFSSRSKTSISWTDFEQLFTSSVSEAELRVRHFLYPIVLNWGLSCMFSTVYALLPNGNTFIIQPVPSDTSLRRTDFILLHFKFYRLIIELLFISSSLPYSLLRARHPPCGPPT